MAVFMTGETYHEREKSHTPLKGCALLIDCCVCGLKEQSKVHMLVCSHTLLGNLLEWYRKELLPIVENIFKGNMTSANFFQNHLFEHI